MAEIDLRCGLLIDVVTIAYGVTMHNILPYYCTDEAPAQAEPSDVADFLEIDIIPAWVALLSSVATLSHVSIDTTAPTGYVPYPTYFRSVNESGPDTASGMLPPYAALRLVKIPDSESEDADTPPTPWRAGSVRIGGIPESSSDSGGFISSAYEAGLEDLGQFLAALDVGGIGYAMYMKRTVGATNYYTPVSSLEPGLILTTQNSRKYAY